jgi:hypothetical protein
MRNRLVTAYTLGAILLLCLCFASVSNAESNPVVSVSTPAGASATPTDTPLSLPSSSPTPTACTIEFSDVPPGSTFYPYVRCLACRGHISGYADGTFRPNNVATRAQLAKIISNAAGFRWPVPPDTQSFEDVLPTDTFWVFIERLYPRAAVVGYPCGWTPGEPCVPPQNRPYFRPNAPATRGQATKILDIAFGHHTEPVPENQQSFEDVPRIHTFWEDVERLAVRGIIHGYPCGGANEPCVPPRNRPYFRPNTSITRGQLTKMVANSAYMGCYTP